MQKSSIVILSMCLGLAACNQSSTQKNELASGQTKTVEASEASTVSDIKASSVSALPKNLLYGEGAGLAKMIQYSYENHVGAWNPENLVLRNQELFANYVNDNPSQSECWYIGDSYNPDKTPPQWAIIELTQAKTINYIGILSSEYYSGEGYSERHVKDAQVWVSTSDTEHFEKILPITLHSNQFFEVFRIEPKENVKFIKYLVQSNYGHQETAIAPIVAFYDETPIQPTKDRILAGKTDVYTIFFGLENATLRPESDPMLQEIVGILKADTTKKVEITVHNDSKKDEAQNKKLTQDRANTLKSRLKMIGIDEKRITAIGAGASQAIASNDSEYDRSKNRRVSIWVK